MTSKCYKSVSKPHAYIKTSKKCILEHHATGKQFFGELFWQNIHKLSPRGLHRNHRRGG